MDFLPDAPQVIQLPPLSYAWMIYEIGCLVCTRPDDVYHPFRIHGHLRISDSHGECSKR
jgi:hypothetical protein